VLLLAFASAGQAAFFSSSTGARPLAMGNAFVGLADDGSALFVNPAGLADRTGLTLVSMYTQPDPEITFTSLGGANVLFGGVLGFGYRSQTNANIPISTTESVDFSNTELLLAYARPVSELVSVGADLRLLSKGPSKSFSGSDGVTASGTAADLSLKYRYSPALSLGLIWQDIGGKLTYKNGAVETFPASFVVGSSYKFSWPIIFDLDLNKVEEKPFLLHAGLEWSPVSLLALRAGLDQSSAGTGTTTYTNMTGGLGIKVSGITLDYALFKQGDPTGAISHYFSFGYVGVPKTPPPVVTTYPTPEPTPEAKIPRVQFPDIPAKHWAKTEIEELATAGLIWGYPDGNFNPNKKLSRAEFASIVATAKHLEPIPVDNPNKLITRGDAAKLLDLTDPISKPTATITRAEAAVLLYKTPFAQAALKRLPPLEN
jgi:hypothetical protein